MECSFEVKEMPAFPVAYVRHVGPYPEIGGAFEKIEKWVAERKLWKPETVSLGIYLDDPQAVPPEKLRSDACVVVPPDTLPEGEVQIQDVPGGLYAVLHCVLDHTEFLKAWQTLFAEYLSKGDYEFDDRPCYEHYTGFKDGKFIVDICEPIKAK